MKKLLFVAVSAALCQAALAAGVEVNAPWARQTVQGMVNGGVFMDLKNDTPAEITLVGGSSPAAKSVEIHEHVHAEIKDPKTGQKAMGMKMQAVPGGLKVAKGQTVNLKPGSYHVMLMGLTKPLQPGDKFPLTLKFKGAPDKTVTVEVRANADKGKPPMPPHGHGSEPQGQTAPQHGH
ncbi:MAG: copper chaperone PCu(A)C [Neisseria sp.]|nr:copper chaperone PCu(A)C [Neisseria sp.]